MIKKKLNPRKSNYKFFDKESFDDTREEEGCKSNTRVKRVTMLSTPEQIEVPSPKIADYNRKIKFPQYQRS